MTTILFCITTKKISIKDIKEQVKQMLCKDIVLHFCCEKNNTLLNEFDQLISDKKMPIEISIYPVGTSEESMIEDTIKSMHNTRFVLVRNDANFSADLVEDLITESMFGYDIVMAKKQRKENFFRNVINKVSKKISDLFFNFSFYDGDIGIQLFSEQAHSIMKTTNVTLLTKINRWIALNIKYIDKNIEKTIIKNKKFENNIISAIIYLGIFVLTLVGAIIFNSFISISFIGWLVLIFVYFACIALGLRALMNIYSTNKIGIIYCDKVSAIERKVL